LHHIALYPVGSIVRLSTGDIGVVKQVFSGLQTRPVVQLVVNRKYVLYDSLVELDLSTQLTVFVKALLDEATVSALTRKLGKADVFRRVSTG
jgi:hypothetical protein